MNLDPLHWECGLKPAEEPISGVSPAQINLT